MPQTIDAKGHLEAILCVGRARHDLQARITDEGTQGWQGAFGHLSGKRAHRGQGSQVKGHPRDVLVAGFMLQRANRPRTLSLVAAGNDDMPVGVRGGERACIHIPQPGGPSRDNDNVSAAASPGTPSARRSPWSAEYGRRRT